MSAPGPQDVPGILDFVSSCHPLDRMPPSVSYALAAAADTVVVPEGTVVFADGDLNDLVHLVRSGAVEQRESDGSLRARLGEGDFFGRRSATSGTRTGYSATAIEDTVLHRFPIGIFDELVAEVPDVREAFAGAEVRLQHALRSTGAITAMGTVTGSPVRDLVARPAVRIGPGSTVQEAAAAMTAAGTSLACVQQGEELVGVVTDRDLRARVLAQGCGLDTLVAQVMTPDPCTILGSRSAFEAMIVMVENDVRHLPVREGGMILGVVSATDLFRDHHSVQPIDLARRVSEASTIGELATTMSELPQLQAALLLAEQSPEEVAHVVTSIVDACTSRLLVLAEERLGPPPSRYVWMAAGAQARRGLTVGSPQSSVLVREDLDLGDEFALADAEQYFSELARRVNNGLEVCGIEQNGHGLTTTFPRWRQPLSQWREYYERWIVDPDAEELRAVTDLLDVRPVHGDAGLAEEIEGILRDLLRRPVPLLRALTSNALRTSPPLGFFRTFVLSRDGEGQKVLDIESGGIGPILDIARIYALAAGSLAPESFARLEAAQEAGLMTPAAARDLLNALTLMAGVRLRHRQERRESALAMNDDLAPDAMTGYERGHLKDAFTIVRDAQTELRRFAAQLA
ncbi:putative nucleotidyltransferase substrate binding domain-containing protein [Brachybacterium hainanense]|uniref:Nucleotidyltransferase substrate binding domain-containing protein n=1 Tax=Brachybacterium hainanense TaxID=1541174 RepID=A0ABV6R649_9MICO